MTHIFRKELSQKQGTPQPVAGPPTHEVSHLNLRKDGPPTPRRAWEFQLSRIAYLQQNLASFSKVAPEIKGEQCGEQCSRGLPVSRCSLVRQGSSQMLQVLPPQEHGASEKSCRESVPALSRAQCSLPTWGALASAGMACGQGHQQQP